ncbi:MAG TPA: protein translocase subunit SecF [Alphaproteobacteria bacterium]|nr:protein translocase subunit SecF [Alphaproteobacteria bacterium]
MKKLKLIPDNTNIKFAEKRVICVSLSVLFIVLSIVLYFTRGLNYGIDFEGGIMIEVKTPQVAELAKIRSALNSLDLGDVGIQTFGAPDDILIRVEKQDGGDKAQEIAVTKIKDTLDKVIAGKPQYRRTEVVGPKVSGELKQQGFIAMTLAILAMVIYVWFRFEWQFGVGTVLALIHDATLTIGFFSITRLEFNLSVVAAILTIVGYSMNDSVVVFDRIRENLRKYKKMGLVDLINLSVNETLSRTIMTAMTTFLALLALFFFGGEVIRAFSAAMLFGVFIGTYSSIYVGAPVLIWFNLRSEDVQIQAPSGAAKKNTP